MGGFRSVSIVLAIAIVLGATTAGSAQTSGAQIDEALQNITALPRPGRVGYATFWDGNKFVQCRRMPGRELRCEAAGSSMQPSLRRLLTPERLGRMAALGWILDPSFGNHVQTFPADMATARIAEQIMRTLTEGYGADAVQIEMQTAWVADIPCPPRAGPSQNLAGSVNDTPEMLATAIRSCSYKPESDTIQVAGSAEELVAIHQATAAAEIQRLRLNRTRRVFVVFATGIGYVQCAPETSPSAIYCEAQSSESWPALTSILTPDRVARLHQAGFTDPGRSPNFSRRYPTSAFTDAAVAREILTILFDVYGYTGVSRLEIKTE